MRNVRARMRAALGLPAEPAKEEPEYEPGGILVGSALELIGAAKLAEILRQPVRDGQEFYNLVELGEASASVEELRRKLNPDNRVRRSMSEMSEEIIPEPIIARPIEREIPRAEPRPVSVPKSTPKPPAIAEPPDETIAAAASERIVMSGNLLTEDLRGLFESAGVGQTDSANLRLAATVLQGRAAELETISRQLRVAPRKGGHASREAVAEELSRLQSGPDLASTRERRKELAAQLRALERA